MLVSYGRTTGWSHNVCVGVQPFGDSYRIDHPCLCLITFRICVHEREFLPTICQCAEGRGKVWLALHA